MKKWFLIQIIIILSLSACQQSKNPAVIKFTEEEKLLGGPLYRTPADVVLLIQSHFVDPPGRTDRCPTCSALEMYHLEARYEEAVLAVSRQEGITAPVLPAAEAEGAAACRFTVTKPLEERAACRLDYSIYAAEDQVYSLWIGAALVIDGCLEPGTTIIYPASTPQAQILEEMAGYLPNQLS